MTTISHTGSADIGIIGERSPHSPMVLSAADISTSADPLDVCSDTSRFRATHGTFGRRLRPEIADLPALTEQKTVVTWRKDDPYNCHVFHTWEHIERVWGRFFEICAVKPLYLDAQALVVCQRPD